MLYETLEQDSQPSCRFGLELVENLDVDDKARLNPPHTHTRFSVAPCKCGGTEDQITCGVAGGDSDEEVGDKAEAL